MKNLKQKILSVAKIIILSLMVGISGGDLLATHWNDPSWGPNPSSHLFTSPNPWTSPTTTPFFLPPHPQAENVDLPLNVSNSPQIKDGPLLLNSVPSSQGFMLTVPYKGILIGNINPSTIQFTPGLLHIYNGAGRGTVNTTITPPPAIRIDEMGRALVTDSPDARIGIGTLTPEYTIDIPNGNSIVRIGGPDLLPNSEISLQTLGRIRIMGGNPSAGAFLVSLDYEGEAVWVNTPVTGGIFYPHKSLVNFSSTAGITTTVPTGGFNPLSSVQPGLWQVTVWGTTGNTGNNLSKTTRIRMFWAGPRNPFSEDILFETRDSDGTDPFSVTRIIRVWHNEFNISVSDPNNPATPPRINGITAVWLGQ